jgi:hypothetical protein
LILALRGKDLALEDMQTIEKDISFPQYVFSIVCMFHVLTEFDEIKRSCPRRLAGHNEQRCKPHAKSSSVAAAAAVAIHLSFNCRTFFYS